jgi:putative ABC transport system ATP-binding protein
MGSNSLESESALHSTEEAIKHINCLIVTERKDTVVLFIYAAAIGILSLGVPLSVQVLVNTISFGSLLQPILVLSLVLLCLLVSAAICEVLQYYVVEIMERRLFVRFSLIIIERVTRFKGLVFRNEFIPELSNRFFEMVIVQKTFSYLVLDSIALILKLFIGLILVSLYHPFFFIFSIMLFVFTFLAIFIPFKVGVTRSIKTCSAKHSVFIWLETIAQHPNVFRSKKGMKWGVMKGDSIIHYYLEARKEHFTVVLAQKIAFITIGAIGTALLLAVGGYLITIKQLTIGQLVAAEIILGGIFLAIAKTDKILVNYYDLAASLAKLDTLLNLPVEDISGDVFDVENGVDILIDSLEWRSPDDPQDYYGLSVKIQGGEKVAILGESGSGKSYVSDILYGLLTDYKGRIYFSGQNIRNISKQSLRSHVMLLKGISLFKGTIFENVVTGSENIGTEVVRSVLQKVGLYRFVEDLPQGLDTVVWNESPLLSSGQKIQLMIARAMFERPEVLILDGVLNMVDDNLLQNVLLPALVNTDNTSTVIVMTSRRWIAEKFNRFLTIDRITNSSN